MHQKPTHNLTARQKFLRAAATAAAAAAAVEGGAAAAPYLDSATKNYDLPPMDNCSAYNVVLSDDATSPAEINQHAIASIFNEPAGKTSVILQSILSKGGTTGRIDHMITQDVGIEINSKINEDSGSYSASCDYRGPLIDIAIKNPLLIATNGRPYKETQPEDFLHFKAIANLDDAASGNKAVAYYEENSGTLFMGTVGLTADENNDRAWAAITGNTERLVPNEFADNFLGEVTDQIKQQGLEVNNTAIFSHSLGTAGGILLKAKIQDSFANQHIFGKNPQLTIVEGFGESLAAEAIIKDTGLAPQQLTRNTLSIRSGGEGTANIIASEWESNKTIGLNTYSVTAPEEENTHRLPEMVKGLINGTRTINPTNELFLPNKWDRIKGEGLELVGEASRVGRNIRNSIGRG